MFACPDLQDIGADRSLKGELRQSISVEINFQSAIYCHYIENYWSQYDTAETDCGVLRITRAASTQNVEKLGLWIGSWK